eukprot:TRINITY_DN1428_c0_g1_i7.p1 TRINITY_DN1428_c0_g1~~TRINITY_DN1428_c0_g1_i7.p1  ORF type:complete len:404 (-),score=88.39 TRINITY_DN1428_c0_g1_i7:613-1824(-)
MHKSERKRKNRSGSKSSGSIPAFLLKTYEILENPVYADIISWNRDGSAFVVKKVNEFSEKILPKYFKHNNFASFVRQLNMYDFHKTRHENNENEFKHKLFRRGHKNQLTEIKRKTTDGSTITAPNTQIIPFTQPKEVNDERLRRDFSSYAQEVLPFYHLTFIVQLIHLRTRQEENDSLLKKLSVQNGQIVEWNRLLWNEIKHRAEKHEKREGEFKELIMQMFHVFALYARTSNRSAAPQAIEDKKGGSILEETKETKEDVPPATLDREASTEQQRNTLFSMLDQSSLSREQRKMLKKFNKLLDQKDLKDLPDKNSLLGQPPQFSDQAPSLSALMTTFEDVLRKSTPDREPTILSHLLGKRKRGKRTAESDLPPPPPFPLYTTDDSINSQVNVTLTSHRICSEC